MQILSTRSLKILYETKVQADQLRHPKNLNLNLEKNENKAFSFRYDSYKLNIFLTQKDKSVLIALYLRTKLTFFSFNLDGSLWTSEASKDIPVDIESGERGIQVYLDFREDFIYVRRYFGEPACCIIMDTQ
jgi:hypothetical protein